MGGSSDEGRKRMISRGEVDFLLGFGDLSLCRPKFPLSGALSPFSPLSPLSPLSPFSLGGRFPLNSFTLTLLPSTGYVGRYTEFPVY